MFQLTPAEKTEVVTVCDHLQKLKFSKALPYAFTEHGAIQAANVLASPRAVEMGIYVVRAFVRLKQAATSHTDLARRLDELEEKTEAVALSHDTFSRNTRAQLKQVFDALRELTMPPDPSKRPIGPVHQLVGRTPGGALAVQVDGELVAIAHQAPVAAQRQRDCGPAHRRELDRAGGCSAR